jgi:hypothetical protein
MQQLSICIEQTKQEEAKTPAANSVDIKVAPEEPSEIGRLEKEYIKLQKRYCLITDPEYMMELQTQLRELEAAYKEKLQQINTMEVNQKKTDR